MHGMIPFNSVHSATFQDSHVSAIKGIKDIIVHHPSVIAGWGFEEKPLVGRSCHYFGVRCVLKQGQHLVMFAEWTNILYYCIFAKALEGFSNILKNASFTLLHRLPGVRVCSCETNREASVSFCFCF